MIVALKREDGTTQSLEEHALKTAELAQTLNILMEDRRMFDGNIPLR